MKNKKLKKFISLFAFLGDAGRFLSSDKISDYYRQTYAELIQNTHTKLENGEFSVYPVIEEIEENLSQLNQLDSYIIRLLRNFRDIAPYLLINIEKEYSVDFGKNSLKIGTTTYYEGHVNCHKTLERYCNWEKPNLDYRQASSYEKYIILCFKAFIEFFNRLDALCLDYKLDIEELQQRQNIKVWIRDHSMLRNMGYNANIKQKKVLPHQTINNDAETKKYTAKHYVLAYLFECNAKGESFPIGKKNELEKIGNNRIGSGKGNRFYKVFNELINKDLNVEDNLIEIGGENWRKAVKELTNTPELVEEYLQSKQL